MLQTDCFYEAVDIYISKEIGNVLCFIFVGTKNSWSTYLVTQLTNIILTDLTPNISILGCGWIGFPLAVELKRRGCSVKGSTTTAEKMEALEQAGISPYLITLNPIADSNLIGDFFQCDTLIINIPPRLRAHDGEFHIAQVNAIKGLVLDLKSKPKKVIFISATSVYSDVAGEFDESFDITSENTGNKTLFEAEKIIKGLGIPYIIVRAGGLAGYDRMLARHFAGKENLTGGNMPVNHIHRDDVVEIVCKLVFSEVINEVYNAVAPEHPTRKDLYLSLCERYNLPAPHFDPNDSSTGKILVGNKLEKDFGFTYKFPDPYTFYHDLVV